MMEEAAVKFRRFLFAFGIVLGWGLGGLSPIQAQSITDTYEIRVAGFKIGDLKAKFFQIGEKQNLQLQSQVSFWFFGKIYLDHEINCDYRGRQLITSEVSSKSNRGDFFSKIEWDENYYRVDAETYKFENSKAISQVIEGSTAKFYFEKPKDGDFIVSETFGLMSEVEEVEQDVFEIEINGNRNRFYYTGQELTKVVIQNPIKNYVIQKVN